MDSVDRVKNMVRRSLIVKPDITNKELLERAREIAPQAVEGLSLRQFHARYRLPILRHEIGERRRRSNGDRAGQRVARSTSKSDGAAPSAAEASTPAASSSSPNGLPDTRTRSRRKTAQPETRALENAIREVLIEFAIQLGEAESRGALVRVIGGVDTVVTRLAAIARGHSPNPSRDAA
ncbi:MAG: hypothetical protein L0271_12170 [Gemmatimonadetes bacterium]|nr:hypothetical protein [Gemmatimonadota bacterium]